ncbi:hypothetical protein RND71_019175 [Anisodus tanguticus]|uniref:Uncharacterized protein n=1 Tax=Anisodus tanguticus TaxID=243964 RepID=A0AAE1RYI3_9SOLA|nr:hypothetical protein RND71_019175 [Anisodus tanguticus]
MISNSHIDLVSCEGYRSLYQFFSSSVSPISQTSKVWVRMLPFSMPLILFTCVFYCIREICTTF